MMTIEEQGFSILSGSKLVAQAFNDMLKRHYGDIGKAPVRIILDVPWGFAFDAMLQQPSEQGRFAATLVITDNPCREYWDDLWDTGPNIILAGDPHVEDLRLALSLASQAKVMRLTPSFEPILTPAERSVLRLCANANTNKQIAKMLNVTERTIQNRLSAIFSKLQLSSRSQAVLYYWGMQHLSYDA